jgi:hypothetical protein
VLMMTAREMGCSGESTVHQPAARAG